MAVLVDPTTGAVGKKTGRAVLSDGSQLLAVKWNQKQDFNEAGEEMVTATVEQVADGLIFQVNSADDTGISSYTGASTTSKVTYGDTNADTIQKVLDVINGIGASSGTVQGRAKVVHTLSEASKLQPGDILVCEMTMPPWTPLFSIASAVVADTGGVLSHCAIVSREYGMPCVVGTLVGTAVLQDGMLLTVDGSQGIVRIDAR